ncbi:hypothetical protein [Pseudomonas serbica]|uniref:hypothetical protein n=1 Tax=Pseudomonas serbica TaxID=2965074 RepID=UPI00237A5A49|nr:hypothetical protein [Pseudomonas serbica]
MSSSFNDRIIQCYDRCDLMVGRWRMTEAICSSKGICVLLDGKPFVFCGMHDCDQSVRQANDLAGSAQLLAAVKGFGLGTTLSVGVVKGRSIDASHFPSVLLKEEFGGGVEGTMVEFFRIDHPGQILIAQMLVIDDQIGPLLHPGEWTKTGFDIVHEWQEIKEHCAGLFIADEMDKLAELAKQNNATKMT